ncbi:MAG: hypothetical protein DRP64_16755, partial [Verrucomicrobia bacterium]
SEMENRTPCYTIGGNIYKTGSGMIIPDCNFNVNGYRLPTSEEWEYAARGGNSSRRFPWGDTISHSKANYEGDSGTYSYDDSDGYHPSYYTGDYPCTSPVGSFAANGYGLHDMSGNVREWCWRVASEYLNQVIRGGAWNELANTSRTGNSYIIGAGSWGHNLGFRTVLNAE